MADKTSKLDLAQVLAAAQDDSNRGFCTACGAEADGVEPDARNYQCDACGALAVFGAEQILVECLI